VSSRRLRSDALYCSSKCRQKAYRRRSTKRRPRETVVRGTNADLIAVAAKLYLPAGATVADVTYGKGVFWRNLATARFTLLSSDIDPEAGVTVADFRALPYEDGSVDVVVLDPPYVHGGVVAGVDRCYNNAATTPQLGHDSILKLYRQGIVEATRVVRPGGQLWVKCKDEIESGRQRWSHIELLDIACGLGWRGRDLFVLTPSSRIPANRGRRQLHAHKTHSFLWILDKRAAECRS
jgi:hypothetical protein